MSKTSSLITAKRLKELREEKKLSHIALSKALKEQYGIDISRDSLMCYEVSDPHHTKAYKNEGMRIEYLRCFSEFYCVSSDYLLGLTEDRNKKPSAVDELGLSTKIIDIIKEWHEYYDESYGNSLDGLNMFLETTLESPLYEMITCFTAHVNSESSASDTTSLLYELAKQVYKDVPLPSPEDDSIIGFYKRFTDTAKDSNIGLRLAYILTNLYPETRGRISVSFGSQTLEPEFNTICSCLRRCLESITGYREYLDNLS